MTGVGVTSLAALAPARRAATVAPIAALSGRSDNVGAASRKRVVTGVALVAVGLAAGVAGLGGAGSRRVGIAVGAMAMFVGVTVLSPLAVGLVTRVVRMADAGRRRRRRPSRAAERGAQLAPHRHDRGGADDRPRRSSRCTRRRRLGQGVDGSTFERSAKADYFVTDELETSSSRRRSPSRSGSRTRCAPRPVSRTSTHASTARSPSVVGFDFDQIDDVLDLGVTQGGFDTAPAPGCRLGRRGEGHGAESVTP